MHHQHSSREFVKVRFSLQESTPKHSTPDWWRGHCDETRIGHHHDTQLEAQNHYKL